MGETDQNPGRSPSRRCPASATAGSRPMLLPSAAGVPLRSDAMANFKNFDARQHKAMKRIWMRAGSAMREAQAAYVNNEQMFRQHFHEWFGNTSKAAVADVVETLAYMSGEYERQSLDIEMAPPSGGENANVQHF